MKYSWLFSWGILMSRRVGGGGLALFLLVGVVLALALVPVGAASFDGTYDYAASGDIEEYRVDALFRGLNPDEPNRIVRVGKTAYAPMR